MINTQLLLEHMIQNTVRLVANHLSCSMELNRIFAVHKSTSDTAQLYRTPLHVLAVLFGRTSLVKSHSKWALHFFIHVGNHKTVDWARHVVLFYVLNSNQNTSALEYSVFVSVIRTHGK